ncbi:MAG: hypothetical protein CMK07_07485 [Ponticaulis sp.]|nr:hypothetical protein [Ponticaulis sp.]
MAIIIAVGQLFLWAALYFSESAARPEGMSPAQEITLHITTDGLIESSFETYTIPLVSDPHYEFRDFVARDAEEEVDRIGVFETTFTVTDPNEDVGLFLGYNYQINEVRVNNTIIKAHTVADAWGLASGFSPSAYIIPKDILTSGENTLTLESAGYLTKRAPTYHVGDVANVLTAQAWGRIFATDLAMVAVALMAFVILLCFVMDWPKEDRPRITALIILLCLWSARDLLLLGIDRNLSPRLSWWLYHAVSYSLTLALLDFSLAWTGLFNRVRRVLWGGYLVCVILPAVLVINHWTRWQLTDAGWLIDVWLTNILAPIVIVIFAWDFATKRPRETIVALLFIVCASALLIDAVDDQFGLHVPFNDNLYLTFYFAPLCGAFLGLGMTASIAAQATRSRRAVLEMNEVLEQRLAEREKQIRTQAKSRAVLDERRRIMSDMHDGLGARLSGIVLQTRTRKLPYSDVPGAVQESLDELRLIIDSLDSAGDTLAIALGAFRERIQQQFCAAGIALDWSIDEGAVSARYSASEVLQIFRILQECCTNIIRHAKASNVAFALRRVEGDHPIEITVRDDGCGLREGDNPNGKGLKNMAMRARRIGALFSLQNIGPGVEMCLRLPREHSEA